MRQRNGRHIVHLVRLHHDANLAARLDSIAIVHAVEGLRDFLQTRQTLQIRFEAFAPRARPSRRDGVRRRDQNGLHRRRFLVAVMGGNRVDDLGGLAMLACNVRADCHMRPVALMVDGLADIVQKSAAFRQRDVHAQLRGHDPRKLRDLNGMIEHVLPIARAIAEPPQKPDQFRMQPMNARIERRLLSGLLDALVDFAFRLVHHFLDTGRMNAPVRNQLFESDTRDFAANRIEAGQNNRFRRIVNNQVNAGQGFQRADVAAFAADNAPLHLVVRQRDDGNGRLRHLIGGAALNGLRHDVAGALVRLVLCLLLVFLDHHGLLVAHFFFRLGHQHRFRFFGRQL